MTEGPQDPIAALTDKLLGVLVMVGLILAGLSALFFLQSLFERRDTAVLRTIPDLLITWREGGELFWPMLLILFAPAFLVPGAFGLDRWAARAGARGSRWTIVGAAAACVAAGVGWGALDGREELAVATPFGVSWLYDGKPREYWTWGAADSLGVGCVTTTDAKTREVQHALNYDVALPSGREAKLIRDQAEIPRLIARLTPIDKTLRAQAVPRFASVEAACLKHYGQGLTEAERAALTALLSR
jgi:hypothetical protein